jgi:hypothetical protein
MAKIDPDGVTGEVEPFMVYCNMTVDGGLTQVGKLVSCTHFVILNS